MKELFGQHLGQISKARAPFTLEYCQLTGVIQDGKIECIAYDTSFFARPLFNTAFQSVPSQNWLNKYKTQFFGIVGYEKTIKENAIFLGVLPLNIDAYNTDAIQDVHKIQTEKFDIVIDDANDMLSVIRYAGNKIVMKGDNVFIESDSINLGKETADQPVPLGNTLVDTLKNLIQTIQAGKVMTSIGPQSFMADTQAALSEIANNLDTILSQVTNTD